MALPGALSERARKGWPEPTLTVEWGQSRHAGAAALGALLGDQPGEAVEAQEGSSSMRAQLAPT